MIGRLRAALQVLLHVDDSPHRIALAFGIGMWIAFFPVLGIHTAMGLVIAFAFRLSRAAMLLAVYVNNPWTIAPLYLAGTLLGCALLRVPPEGLSAIDWSADARTFLRTIGGTLRPYLWPYVVGNLVLGTVAGAASYLALRGVLERRRAGAADAAKPGDG